MSPTIIFDFDGTLALGDGPISAYARAIAARVGDETFAARAERALADYATGGSEYRDGYDAVARVAAADCIAGELVSAAYEDSRALLGTAEAAVSAPTDLDAFLRGLKGYATIALATNAPGESVTALLDTWGIRDVFDELHFRVGKPAGLAPIVTAARTRGPVLSVGDIPEFDLMPAAELGADTALVGPAAARSDFTATMRATVISDLYPQIADWAKRSSAVAS